ISLAALEAPMTASVRNADDSETKGGRVVRVIFSVIALSALVLFGIMAFRLLAWSLYNESFWADLVQHHIPAMIGLPLGAVAALEVVLVLEKSSGPIEFELAGVRFKGASGPIAAADQPGTTLARFRDRRHQDRRHSSRTTGRGRTFRSVPPGA